MQSPAGMEEVIFSNVTRAENGRGGSLGGRCGKKGVSGPENNMSITPPAGVGATPRSLMASANQPLLMQ
jgi:hypothetical protein